VCGCRARQLLLHASELPPIKWPSAADAAADATQGLLQVLLALVLLALVLLAAADLLHAGPR
jgi:hypothetical protein